MFFAFLSACSQFGFVIFNLKEIGKKLVSKMLVKLTTGLLTQRQPLPQQPPRLRRPADRSLLHRPNGIGGKIMFFLEMK